MSKTFCAGLWFFSLSIFVAAALLPISSFAEDKEIKEQVTLTELLKEVSVKHPEILESVRVYEGVKEEIGIAKSEYKPTIATEFSAGQEVTDGISTDYDRKDLTVGTAGIYARQNLFKGGGTGHYMDETKARAMSAAYHTLDVANTVFLNTAEAYLNVLKEKELLELAAENVYTQARILKQIKEKTESGFGRASDLLNSQSRLSLTRANYISQQQNLKQASVKLHKQLGRFLDPSVMTEPTIVYQFPSHSDEIVEIAFNNYPALDVAKYNILVKKYSMKRTESEYYPTLDAEVRADYTSNTGGDEGDDRSYSAMLYLNFDLYDGGRKSATKKKNYKELLKEYERSYIERRNLNEAVRLAWNIKEAEDKKHAFLKDYVQLAGETMDAFKEEYQLGRRTLLELLDMENEYQSAKKALAESKYTSLIAYYRVMHITGVLLYSYNTEVFEYVGLNKEQFDLDKLKDYGKLDNNKDKDQMTDNFDQCDNSLPGTFQDYYGCIQSDLINIGYEIPENIEPYIMPKGSQELGALDAQALQADSLEAQVQTESDGSLEALVSTEQQPESAEENVFDIADSSQEQSFDLDNITFMLNRNSLTKEAEKLLEKIAKQLKSLGDFRLEIIGHTDTSGRAAFNQKLSDARAVAVYEKLAELGISRDKMKAYGKGETEPKYSNKTREGRKKNRRIEFKLQKINQ